MTCSPGTTPTGPPRSRRLHGLALCAGGAGLELGIELALGDAYRTVCYVERDAYAAAVLAARMEEGRLDPAPLWDDVSTFDGRRWRGTVDLLTAGFPCQPFSQAGAQQGDRDARHLWPQIRRIINGARPALVFLENVPGVLTVRQRDGRPAYAVIRGELERLGYQVTETLLRASDVGAAHRRERLFICGHAVADAERQRGAGRRRARDVGTSAADRPSETPERERLRDTPHDCRPTLADACRTGCQGGQQPGESTHTGICQDSERAATAQLHRPFLVPPRPDDARGWATTLAVRPDLAPAIEPRLRGVVDGVARGMEFRTQRLRLLGNGVYPLAAAVAFRLLALPFLGESDDRDPARRDLGSLRPENRDSPRGAATPAAVGGRGAEALRLPGH